MRKLHKYHFMCVKVLPKKTGAVDGLALTIILGRAPNRFHSISGLYDKGFNLQATCLSPFINSRKFGYKLNLSNICLGLSAYTNCPHLENLFLFFDCGRLFFNMKFEV